MARPYLSAAQSAAARRGDRLLAPAHSPGAHESGNVSRAGDVLRDDGSWSVRIELRRRVCVLKVEEER